MAQRLRLVNKGEKVKVPVELRAKQVFAFQLSEGGEGLGMVDMEGIIYLRSVDGWIRYDMNIVEAK